MNAREKLIEHFENETGGSLSLEEIQLIDDLEKCPACERRRQWARQYLDASAKHTKEFYENHP